jgi:hypothetical protein
VNEYEYRWAQPSEFSKVDCLLRNKP